MLTPTNYAWIAVAAILLAIVLRPLTSPLRSIPGPFFARFTKLWFLYRVWRGRFDLDLIALHKKHGPIVRYGPYHYSFADPEAVKAIYGHATEFDKSDWYDAWNAPGFKSLFSERSVKIHGQVRRKFQSTYSMSSMVSYEAPAEHCISLLCTRLEEIADGADTSTDMNRWLLSYAADSVSMITYTKRMGFLDEGRDVEGLFKTLHGNLTYATFVGVYASLHPWIHRFSNLLSRLKLSAGTPRMYIGRFNAERVARRREERAVGLEKRDSVASSNEIEDAPKDFLNKFLDFHEQDPSRFTNHDIDIGLAGNVIAGSDTTASSLTSLMYCLLKHPATLAKLRAELESRAQAGNLSSPPTFKEANEIPYLQACIQESMRLFPPVGLPLQREVPAQGAQICGHFFPAGTVVGVHPGTMHVQPSIFGKDAASFRPERWLESDKDTIAMMLRFWMPFGLGSRTCIGKHISMLEISKVVPELVMKFDFELNREVLGEKEEMQWLNRWFLLPEALPVKVRRRKEV